MRSFLADFTLLEDDMLVVDRPRDTRTTEQLVERRANIAPVQRKTYVTRDIDILVIIEERIAALLFDLADNRSDRDIGYFKCYKFLVLSKNRGGRKG